jgi:hypothetical protein
MLSEQSAGETDSRREADSAEIGPATGVSSKLIDSGKVSLFQIGVLEKDLLFCHSGAQPAENIPNRDSQSAHTWFPAALARFNRDSAGARHWHCDTIITSICQVSAG